MARHRLLETVRAYTAERLEEAGEASALRAGHARFYLELAERAEPELTGPEQQRWFERLEVEHANLRSALEWCLSHGESEWGLRLGGALVLFWRPRRCGEPGSWH
jgi:predicted ATPase